MNGREATGAQSGQQLVTAQVVREQVGRIAAEFASGQGVVVETVTSSTGGAAFMYAAGQILIRDEHGPQQVQSVLGDSVVTEPPEDVIPGVQLVRFSPRDPYRPLTVPDAVDLMEAQLGQGSAAPNHVLTVAGEAGPCPATEPEEVYFQIEPLPAVRAGKTGTGSGVRIYIADTGLLSDVASCPWLDGVRGQPDPLDPQPGEIIKPYAGHGTFVAGVARCMAPKADVYVSNVFKTAGSALESDFVKDLAAALEHDVDIFNLSVTTPSRKDLELLGFEAWLHLLKEHPGVVCVVAAGNDGKAGKFWPAAFPGMVSVGALAADWRSKARFSNYGEWVKVYAPGRNIVNAYATGTYECKDAPYEGQLREFFGMASWSGTSFSTPLVAGLIAARKSRTGQTARQTADELLDLAGSQKISEISGLPILLPYGNDFEI